MPTPSPLYNSFMLSIGQQIFWLFILAIPIATIARTVVFEEVFREARDWCKNKSESCSSVWKRKFFYLFTCEYCFSHWVTLFFLVLTQFKLLINDWRGYIIAWFALVFVANIYLNLYSRLRVDISSEKKNIEVKDKEIEKIETEIQETRGNGR
ncbi:MAG TPA: hypothetical protein VGF52_02600 [Tepidisphaeraceae bacterium]